MARVRAYVGLGANMGDAPGTLAAAIHALAALPGARLRGVSRLYATEPVGVARPAGVPQRGRRAGRAARAGPRDRRHRRCSSRSRGWSVRSAGSRGSAGARGRSTSTCSCSGVTGSRSRGPPAGRSDDPAKADSPAHGPASRRPRNRLFVLAPLADLAPGPRAARLGRVGRNGRRAPPPREGPDAARPIATWDGDGWTPVRILIPDRVRGAA